MTVCLAKVGASAGFQEGKGDGRELGRGSGVRSPSRGQLNFCTSEIVYVEMQLETAWCRETVGPLEFAGALSTPPQTQTGACRWLC